MSNRIRTCAKVSAVFWPRQPLQPSGLQDFGSQHLETEASRIPLRALIC
jgi:hypothetical protein